jgi:Domain of unknown function (DUF2017)
MAATFTRGRGGRVKVRLGDEDRSVVAGLLEAVSEMLEPSSTDRTEEPPPDDGDLFARLEAEFAAPRPADPAVARLLPDAHHDDPELAESFRRLTENDLRERKRGARAVAAAALRRPAPVVLSDGEAQALLKGLTDVRLVLAERLGIRTDEDAEFLHAAVAAGADEGDNPWAQTAGLYDVVTFLQEDLVHAILPGG